MVHVHVGRLTWEQCGNGLVGDDGARAKTEVSEGWKIPARTHTQDAIHLVHVY